MRLSSRRINRTICGTASISFAVFGCHGGPAASSPEPAQNDAPRAVVFTVNITPDSAVRLAKYALEGIGDGVVQPPRIRPQMTTVANHQLRNRGGGGQTEIAVIAAIDRHVKDMTKPVTVMELSVWVLDMPQQITRAQQRAGTPVTPLTTNQPRYREPRAMTPSDTLYWRSLELVAETLVQHGAKRLP